MTGRRLATLLGLVLLSALTLLTPAQAATKTVTLSDQGESPASLTIAVGDVVKFVNTGNGSHQVDSGSGWSFHKAIAAGGSASAPAFTKAGKFAYTDSYTLLAIPQNGGGTITVAAGTPSPSPTAKPTASPKPSSAPPPTAQATPSASATPTPTPSATGGTGTATTPGLVIGGVLPSATPSATAVPGPDIASPGPSASAAPVVDIAYGGTAGIVQGSPHRYGLPAALAVVGIVGVLSLLVRFLLAQPEAGR